MFKWKLQLSLLFTLYFKRQRKTSVLWPQVMLHGQEQLQNFRAQNLGSDHNHWFCSKNFLSFLLKFIAFMYVFTWGRACAWTGMDWSENLQDSLTSLLPPDVVTLRVQWQVPLPTNHLPGPSEVPLVWSHLSCSHALSFYTSPLLGRFCLSFCCGESGLSTWQPRGREISTEELLACRHVYVRHIYKHNF